jgi:hypothetical protein
MRRRVRGWLITIADRIAPDEAFRCTGFHFTFERNEGFVVNGDGRGCPLWYQGAADHDRAFTEGSAFS